MDGLKCLADKAFPDLHEEAKQNPTLQLNQPQVAFSVQQKRLATLNDAVQWRIYFRGYPMYPWIPLSTEPDRTVRNNYYLLILLYKTYLLSITLSRVNSVL